MNKKLAVLTLISFLLVSCDKEYLITSDFSYKNNNVSIVDSLGNVNDKKAHVVLLYGQSNAEGSSRIEYLEKKDKVKYDEYANGYDNVYINYVNHDGLSSSNYEFIKCQIGYGYNENCFGPENGIAEIISKEYPSDEVFIVKWTWGGTSLRFDWLDGHHNRGKLYNDSMDFSIKCIDYLLSKGYDLSIDGICWMQGESDSWNNDKYAYYRDTVSFVSGLRKDLSRYQENIKWIDAAINSDENVWKYAHLINDAKIKFSNKSNNNYFIDTNALGIVTNTEPEGSIDFAHYDALSMVKLGQEFGKIVIK